MFAAIGQTRHGERVPDEVVRRAHSECKGGDRVRSLNELHVWMVKKFPETPFFDAAIAEGAYPNALAAFFVSCGWVEWEKHAIWALHGEVYISRLKHAKDSLSEDVHRDHMAGALMHRANGLTHMARCGQLSNLDQMQLPCWDAPKPLVDIAALAVHDLRQSCSLRSLKYGKQGNSKSVLPAYTAALENLATAITIHGNIAGQVPEMVLWLRKRANALVLGSDAALLEACETGAPLDPEEQRAVQKDLRLAETAAACVPHKQMPTTSGDQCLQCRSSAATMIGFACRCRCMCNACADNSSHRSRIQECPSCGDYTEFIPDPTHDQRAAAVSGELTFDLSGLDGNRHMLVGFHGGCPDGCAAAFMLRQTLLRLHAGVIVEMVPFGHQQERFLTVVKPGTIVFSVDITPAESDEPALKDAHQVFIIDHHFSEVAIQDALTKNLPNVTNLSNCHDNECAASLVRELTAPFLKFNDDAVQMFHKMDVFQHELPPRLENDFVNFKAFITQNGERNVSVDLVRQMFEDPVACLSKGKELTAKTKRLTEELSRGITVMAEKDGCWRVLWVQQPAHCRPIDLTLYQDLIDRHQNGTPTLVLTQDSKPLPTGLFNLGLRRAGSEIDVSKVAIKLKATPGFVGGGGHPFAGGAQSNELLLYEQMKQIIQKIMEELCEENEGWEIA